MSRAKHFAAFTFAIANSALVYSIPPQNVSIKAEAHSLATVCEKLTELTGETHRTHSDLKNIPLVISATDQSPESIRKAIARAVTATWTKTGNEFAIQRSSADLTTLRQSEKNRRTELLRYQISEHFKTNAPESWNDESIAKMVDLESKFRSEMIENLSKNIPANSNAIAEISSTDSGAQSAAHIILNAFLKGINPEYLSQLEPYRRVVLSSQPNQSQIGLGTNLSNAIAQYYEVRQRVKQASQGLAFPDNFRFKGGLEIGNAPIARIAKVLISCQYLPQSKTTFLTLKLIDSDQKLIGSCSQSLSGEPSPTTTSDTSATPLNLSESNQDFLALIKAGLPRTAQRGESNSMAISAGDMLLTLNSNDAKNLANPSATALPFLTDLKSNEPLSTFPSQLLQEFATHKNLPIVAVISDDLLGKLANDVTPLAPTTKEVETALSKEYSTQISEGFLIISPLNPLDKESQQIDRSVLTNIITSVRNRGYSRLSDYLACLRLTSNPQSAEDFLPLIIGFTSLDVKNKLSSIGSFSYSQERFAASLPQEVYIEDRPFQTLVASLSPQSKTWLQRAMVETERGPIIMGKGTSVALMIGDGPDEEQPAPFIDATETFPTGIPGNYQLNINPTDNPAVLARAGNSDGRFLTATALGTAQAIGRDNPEFQNSTSFDQYQMAKRIGYELVLQRQNGSDSITRLDDFRLESNASWLRFDQLPDEFKKAVQEASENSRGMRVGGGRNTPPPLH